MDSSLSVLLRTAATIGLVHTALAGFALFASGGAITFLGL